MINVGDIIEITIYPIYHELELQSLTETVVSIDMSEAKLHLLNEGWIQFRRKDVIWYPILFYIHNISIIPVIMFLHEVKINGKLVDKSDLFKYMLSEIKEQV